MSEDERLLLRLSIIGFIIGMVFCDAITIMFASTGDKIVFVAPELSEKLGEPLAIIVQTLAGGVVGFVAFFATRVYYDDRFSLISATLIHMVISVTALVIAGYFLGWIGNTIEDLLLFLILPAMIYVLIWFSVYMSYRISIQRINESIERKRSGKQ